MQKQLTLIIDKIIEEVRQVQVLGADDKIITDITADSRVVEEGSLFICLKGATVDGHKFLQMAVEKGAVAALVEDVPEEIPEGVTLLVVPDTRKAMEAVVPYFYDYPGKNMRMLGITGTNGKTTTTNQAHLIACTTQNSTDDVGSSSFAIGTGDAQHTHIFAGIIVKIRNNGFHCLTGIGNNKKGYSLRDFFGNILNQRGNSTLFYSHLQKFVTINGCTLQTNEQATFLYNAGVCSNIGNNFIVSA